MKRFVSFRIALVCLLGILYVSAVAQSLTDKLEAEETFYKNYGKDAYAKVKLEKDRVGLYDLFGEHIVDGVHIYELSNEANILSNENVSDSVDQASAYEMQKDDFYDKFSNLVVTQDAIGGVKTSFLIGDQIQTKFTPLTFNKENFRGVRWDWWSSGLQFSFAMSRTRPGVVSKKEVEESVAGAYYPIKMADQYREAGLMGNEDFSNVSPYGDYDFLWTAHLETNIANKVDVGATYINHHVSDIKKGPNLIKGNLPDSLMPEHIHFEFFDLTPLDTIDAGVFVEDVTMKVYKNGQMRRVKPRAAYQGVFRRSFVGDQDDVLLPRELPLARPQSGQIPLIVEFKVDPQYWQFEEDGSQFTSIKQVKRIAFEYKVAGNYLVFVSTDRQIPLSIKGKRNALTGEIEYEYPKKTVGEIYDNGLKIYEGGSSAGAVRENEFSTTYFGEYIAQSPRKIPYPDVDFALAIENSGGLLSSAEKQKYHYRVLNYEYNINVSSVTYGLNFRGELAGINFSGEFALNQKEDMLPGAGEESRLVENRIAATLKADRAIGEKMGLNIEGYYISPEWKTSLDPFAASEYFNQTTYKNELKPNGIDTKDTFEIYDYMIYPRPLEHISTIDDNDDNDHFVESEPRRYPSDLDAKDDKNKFYADGRLRGGTEEIRYLEYPNGMRRPYDDPDGVVASVNDKNRNATNDYFEDFLLFASDPPEFELGFDLNNNGVPDKEDDDILPDFGTRSVGYVITGDGIKTQGIMGGNFNLRYTLKNNMTLDVGGVIEQVVDDDLIYNTDDIVANQDFADLELEQDGKSISGNITWNYNVLKRSQGLQYELGAEIRAIKDNIRNDVVITETNRVKEEIQANYYYRIDPLAYRNAFTGGLLGGVTYTNIRNLEYIARLKVGMEKHGALEGQYFSPGWFKGNMWKTYEDRSVLELHAIKKIQYKLMFENEFEDWRSIFNFMNRLTITPQYKIQFSMRKELQGPPETQQDPRDLARSIELDRVPDGVYDEQDLHSIEELEEIEAARQRWDTYRANNYNYLLSVPILKASYKIAEQTELQLGGQLMRYFDIISPEDNFKKLTLLSQVVSKAQYKGYSVTFHMGASLENYNYDINAADPITRRGSKFDTRNYTIFAKLFSGI